MSEVSKIEWCDSTFNPWIGCTKISPACDHCYAEAWSARFGRARWGDHPRERTGEASWRMPRVWQRQADAFEAEHGRARFVFCASLADVFDNQVPEAWRADLFDLMRETPRLVWLLLTKRPQNIAAMLPPDWGDGWPHVWLGTTVENQVVAERNIPALLAVPAAKRFLSCEPLLGPVDLRAGLRTGYECSASCGWRAASEPEEFRCYECGLFAGDNTLEFCATCGSPDVLPVCPKCNADCVTQHPDTVQLDWVIAGGESGKDARISHPQWFRSLRDQCAAAGVPFHFKQWGEWAGISVTEAMNTGGARWASGGPVKRLGKAKAGRLLDGTTHDGRPEAIR